MNKNAIVLAFYFCDYNAKALQMLFFKQKTARGGFLVTSHSERSEESHEILRYACLPARQAQD